MTRAERRDNATLIRRLRVMGACEESREWVREEGFRTLEAAWAACHRVDWLEWLAATGEKRGFKGWSIRRRLRAYAAIGREVEGLAPEGSRSRDRVRIVVKRFEKMSRSLAGVRRLTVRQVVEEWDRLDRFDQLGSLENIGHQYIWTSRVSPTQ